MNTICNFPDIDIYLLLFLDLKNIIVVSIISKAQYALVTKLDYIKELYQIRNIEPNIYNKILRNSNIIDTEFNIIDYAAGCNYIALIRYFNESISSFVYTRGAINNACKNGHIEILEWFDKSKYDFIYALSSINNECENAHIEVLDWFDKSKYDFMYNKNAINNACSQGILQYYIGLINLNMNLYMMSVL